MRKRTTRIISLLLTVVLIVSLVGCATAPVSTTPDATTTPEASITPDATTTQEASTTPDASTAPDVPVVPETPVEDPEDELNETQKNSIALLNYLAVLSQEINASKNSRMFMEEAYASLINNTNPEKVNELTESHLSSMLDIIEKYRMISVKRDRLQYIYDQNKAKALKEAVPNPIGLLSAVSSFDLKRLAASAIYMAVDSYSSYQAYNTEIAQEFLQDGWALDDEEAENLHDSRKRAFMFMIEIVREDELPGELALSESAVEKYVSWKNNTNNFQKIQFFESEEETYKAFGNYWLTLVDCYYEAGDYEKCLESIATYEELQADIFRKDYYFAQTLPKVIVAASEVYSDGKYVPVAEKYIELLIANTESNEWSLRYFAAEMYLDLYAKTGDDLYIEKAYEIILNNVNNLVAEQLEMNDIYVAAVKEVSVPEDATKDEKNQIKDYNKSLNEQRKVELPPVYEPLVLNCDLLFAIAEELDISRTEKNKIEGILRGTGDGLFLSSALENQYTFNSDDVSFEASYDKDTVTLPVSALSEKSVIKVTITNAGKETVYDDWVVKVVDRPSEDFNSFTVTLTSKKAGDQAWSADSKVVVEVFADDTASDVDITLNFTVSKYKDLWIIPDTVEFEQVD